MDKKLIKLMIINKKNTVMIMKMVMRIQIMIIFQVKKWKKKKKVMPMMNKFYNNYNNLIYYKLMKKHNITSKVPH